MEINLARSDVVVLHTCHYILLVVVLHVNSTYVVVLAVSLQGLFKLCVADVCLERVVVVRVSVTHKSNNALCRLVLIEVIEQFCHVVNLVKVVEQRHTEVDLYGLQIFVIEVCILYITVVGEFLYGSNNICELLSRDNLEALHVNSLVLCSTDGVEQITWLIIVA